MKRVITILATMLACITMSAQHLTFKGIEIDGPLNQFVSKMKAEGFSYITSRGNMAIMQGRFTGKDCRFFITADEKEMYVCSVAVVYPKDKSIGVVVDDYIELQELLKAKYELMEVVTDFKFPYELGDGHEMTALCSGKAEIYTTYKADDGIIRLSIHGNDNYEAYVMLFYGDGDNMSRSSESKKIRSSSDL